MKRTKKRWGAGLAKRVGQANLRAALAGVEDAALRKRLRAVLALGPADAGKMDVYLAQVAWRRGRKTAAALACWVETVHDVARLLGVDVGDVECQAPATIRLSMRDDPRAWVTAEAFRRALPSTINFELRDASLGGKRT